MEPLLSFAEELERRDADVAQALARVEAFQAEVEELRARATAAASFLVVLPSALAERSSDEHAAVEARDQAERAVGEAEQIVEHAQKAEQRLEAERARQQARDDLSSAELWLAQARAAHTELERQGAVRHAEAEELARRAVELAPRVRDVPAPSSNLEGALEWASRTRGALILEHSALVLEREEVIREATELMASVLGEPLTATAAAGVRERLARALAEPSS